MEKLGNYWLYSICAGAFCICIATAGVSVFSVIAFLIGFYVMNKERHFETITQNPLTKRIVFFWAMLLLATAFSTNITGSLNEIWSSYFNCLLPFFLILYMGKYINKEKLQWVLWAGFGSMVVTTAACLWQYANGDPRPIGLSGHWMYLGGYYSLFMPLFMIALMDGSLLHTRCQKLVMWAMALFCCAGFIANNTRGAWLAVGITAIICIYLLGRSNKKLWVAGILSLIIFSGIVYTVPSFNQRVQTTVYGVMHITDDVKTVSDQRWYIWRGAIGMFQDKPIAGYGLGTFKDVYNGQYKMATAEKVDYSHAHNMYLHIASEAGVIGLTGLLVLYLYTLYYGGKLYIRGQSIYGLIIVSVMLSMMLHGLTEWNGRIFRISFMLIAWAYVMAEKDGAINRLKSR